MRTLPSALRAVICHRRPAPWCWEAVVAAVGAGATSANGALAQAGPAVRGHADRIAVSLDEYLDRLSPTADGSIEALTLALAGMGDVRALPGARFLAKNGRLPSLRPRAHILALLPAAELLPAVLPALRKKTERYYQNTAVFELLAAWGPAAAPAAPDVVRCLETAYAYDALRILGRIGPPAAAFADRLAAFATGRDPQSRRHHEGMAAWAHWRATREDTLALKVCGAAVRSGGAGRGLPYLADLGPAAAAHADAVHGLLESPGGWTRVAAAHAYWRITGDPEPAVPVLLAAVDPDWTGNPALPTREAVRLLGEIGGPAGAVAPLLRRILASEERLGHPFEGERILADEAYVRTLTEALERIEPGAEDPVPASLAEAAPAAGKGLGLLRRWRAR
ncbi:hypothetical protein [Streptomyces sp. NBC_00454]|uniref:hypothetical protein n=1 Tax=Streptomyces sp. NBC_00454 TaxID=2975747 RepID=UPI0030DF8B47